MTRLVLVAWVATGLLVALGVARPLAVLAQVPTTTTEPTTTTTEPTTTTTTTHACQWEWGGAAEPSPAPCHDESDPAVWSFLALAVLVFATVAHLVGSWGRR